MPSGARGNRISSRAARGVVVSALALASWLGLLSPGGDGVALGQTTVPRIGVLSWYGANSPDDQSFRQALGEQGYVDGTTARIDFRFAEGRSDRATALVTEWLARTST